MTPHARVRQLVPALFMAGIVLALGACGAYPNSTFNHHTDFNTDIDRLWDKLLFWGTLVFVIVEGILIYTFIRFRKREGGPPPEMTHGNTALEITWTLIPVVILVIIAVPTVSTIFRTQAPAPAGALEIEVIGHQWWWEYKYPQYQFVTANEFYVPTGRAVNFTLTTKDVLHSFWVPQLGGKRDLITNRTNHLWYTPNADLESSVWNGFCTEYCGLSHANMRIRAYTVPPAEFESWVAGQKAAAAFTGGAPTSPATPATSGGSTGSAMADAAPEAASVPGATVATASGVIAAQDTPALAPGYVFPTEKLPPSAIPKTPIPAGLTFDDALLAQGDAARGYSLYNSTKGACAACHWNTQMPNMISHTGPNLAHVASRHTIAAGLFPNDGPHLARWIKNARRMKPGVAMYTLGLNEIDPATRQVSTFGKLTDQEIADIVAYLRALK